MNYIPLSTKERTSSCEPPKKKHKKFLMPSDPTLVSRLKTYMQQNPNICLDVNLMADGLQQNYRDYQRKKRTAFRSAVRKAHEYLSENDDEFIASLSSLASIDSEVHSDTNGDSFDSELSIEDDCYLENNNNVNKSLQNLYLPSKQNSSPEKKKRKKIQKHQQKLKMRAETGHPHLPNLNGKRKDPFIEDSTVTFADVGGCDKAVQDICRRLKRFKNPEMYAALNTKSLHGLLLHGPPGTGKTLLAYAIAGELQIPFFKISATELVSGVSGESEQQIRDIFTTAVNKAPCIIFIDEVDAICPKRETAQKEMEKRIVSQLKSCMDALSNKVTASQVLVIGATDRRASLDKTLRGPGRFHHEISLGYPDEKARLEILKVLCRNIKLHENCNLEHFARITYGFVGADLKALVIEAAELAIDRILSANTACENQVTEESKDNLNETQRSIQMLHEDIKLSDDQMQELCIEMIDMEKAMQIVQPIAKLEGFAAIPDVSLDHVGALKNIRKQLKRCILNPICYPKYFETFKIAVETGILLCGPPGCGKTLIAKAIAHEAGVGFIAVSGPELLSMYVGESERAVRECFENARNASPCIIFFDELDSLCPRRSSSSENAATSRVVNQLLAEMDGIVSRKGVHMIGTTNRPDIIDPAILRFGRFGKILYIGLPSTSDRVDILTTLTKGAKRPIAADVCLTRLSEDERCNRFTGADLAALVKEASTIAVEDLIGGSKRPQEITEKDFDEAFKTTKPSVSKKDVFKFEKMLKRYSL